MIRLRELITVLSTLALATALAAETPIAVGKTEKVVAENALFARVCASFTFTNPNARPMQGELELPLPPDAVVCGYRLEVNGEMVPGVVCEKEKARVAFENETRKGVDPGLVERVKGNVWKTRIFPLNPNVPRRAEVEYIRYAGEATSPSLQNGESKDTVVYERDGDTIYRATRNAQFEDSPIRQFSQGAILWDASLSREGKVASDRARLAAQLPEKGDWKLITYSNVPDAPRAFTEKAALLAAIDNVVYDGATDLDAALALCVGEKRLVFTDELDTSDHLVTVEKLSPAEVKGLGRACHSVTAAPDGAVPSGTLLATVWTARNAKDLATCRKYGVAGPGMSLIVLETLQQWLDNKIEPPANLAVHAQWVERRKGEDDPIAAKKAQAEHEALLLRYWEERVKWWNDPKPKIPTPSSGLFDTAATGGTAGMRYLSTSAGAARSARMSRSVQRTAEPPMAMAAASANFAVAAAAEDLEAEGFVASGAAPLRKAVAAGAAGSSTAPAVTLKAWDPKTPYLDALKKAFGEATSPSLQPEAFVRAYAEYLVQRKAYRESPAFYLDVAGWFFNKGDVPHGLRILSNLAEFKLEDAALWRTMGWRLREAAAVAGRPPYPAALPLYDAAVRVFRHVKEMRGEEGQGYRDLATVLTERGKAAALGDAASRRVNPSDDLTEAAQLLRDCAFTNHARRAARRGNDFQVSLFALEDLNGLLAWCAAHADAVPGFKAPALDAAYRRDLPVKLRIVLTWDADETDIDLHVLEPNGEECFYGHRRTAEGGFCSEDVTTGYGPEEYLKKELERGTYKVLTNYFASHQTALTGATTVQATVYTDWATAAEKMQVLTLRLDKPRDRQPIGEVTL